MIHSYGLKIEEVKVINIEKRKISDNEYDRTMKEITETSTNKLQKIACFSGMSWYFHNIVEELQKRGIK